MTRPAIPRTLFPFCAVLVLAAWASPASAALNLCNRTSYVLYASAGLLTRTAAVTQGWTRIAPGACAAAVGGGLGAQPYYIYARTSQAHSGPAHAWGGQRPMCVKDTNYTLEVPLGANRCPSDDAFEVPFARIDPKGARSWTATLTAPGIATLAAAREAGIARLLGDVGYRIGRGPGALGAARALNDFRTRMKLSKDADSADLFDALETEALKVAAPAGYSICNDTDAPAWAALGLQTGANWVSRGWWKVQPGACARAIATKLAAAKVYLLVEGKGGRKLVTGRDTFCVTNITFQIEGRERCAARGLVAAGFAATATKGLSGYAAHVSEDGLLTPPRLTGQSSSPK